MSFSGALPHCPQGLTVEDLSSVVNIAVFLVALLSLDSLSAGVLHKLIRMELRGDGGFRVSVDLGLIGYRSERQ